MRKRCDSVWVPLMVLGLAFWIFPAASAAAESVPLARFGDKGVVRLEVAQTEEEIERGLMFRTELAQDQGMVFLFHPARAVNFWMYNCFIPLDMIFVRDGKIVKIFENVPPCRSKVPGQCPRYPEGEGIAVTEVVEVKAGYAGSRGIKEGDPVTFELP